MGVDLVRAIRITRTDVGYLYTAGAGVIHSRKNGNMDFGRALTRALNNQGVVSNTWRDGEPMSSR